jgi:ABC-type transport system substrate-binding protein
MKEKTVLIASLIIATMVLLTFVGTVSAWEYANIPNVANSNSFAELFGPRLDRIQIQEYADETSEFNALAAGTIDLTDWPVPKDFYMTWTQPTYTGNVAVSHIIDDFSMTIIDMRLDNRSTLDDGVTPNPAYNWMENTGSPIPEPFGNPMADVWLRRAIATTVDRNNFIINTVSGGNPPYLLAPLYTPCDAAYGAYQQPQISLIGALANYTYASLTGPFGGANIAWGNEMLDLHGYSSDGIKAHGAINGKKFGLDFYYRSDISYRMELATDMQPLLTNNPPNGLGLNINMIPITLAGASTTVMTAKKGHMYTGGWGLTQDPDHLYYLFNIFDYWSNGQPPNYMYYPGDAATFTVPADGNTYYYNQTTAGWPVNYDDGTGVGPNLTFEDNGNALLPGKYYVNPENYWSQQMMSSSGARAIFCAWRCQEFLAYWVCGVPVYSNGGYAAYSKVYVTADTHHNQPWMGVVNANASGVWNIYSAYNMHPADANWGTGSATNITMVWGFKSPTQSLNPIYAGSVWDWYVMNNCYDTMIRFQPYTLGDTGNLALNWTVDTWPGSSVGLGTCSRITFNMRHDLLWSDGMPLTSSDIAFTWGGPLVPGSLSYMLAAHGDPPAYWSGNLAHIISIWTPDPWTVVILLDVQSCFALHSMSGWNIVLPQHIWQPIILTGTHILDSFNGPKVCSGGWLMQSTQDPATNGGTIILVKNPLHNMQVSNPSGSGSVPMPLTIDTKQTSNATSSPAAWLAEIGSTHWIWPKKGQTGVSVTDTITIDSSYYYTTGPAITQVYPYTLLTGLKNVTLWKWTGTGQPEDFTQYKQIATLVTNKAWTAGRNGTDATPDVETVPIGGLTPDYYIIKVDAIITDLEVSTDNGATFTTITPSLNPFNGLVKTYNEWCIVTARSDITGRLWKPTILPKWQTVPDLSVDGSDVIIAAKAFGSYPGSPRWNPAADITGDFNVDGLDIIQIARDFGWGAAIVDP